MKPWAWFSFGFLSGVVVLFVALVLLSWLTTFEDCPDATASALRFVKPTY